MVDRAYQQDRVAEAFRSQYAKAAKICTAQGDLKGAEDCFQLALAEEPMNAALHDRVAWFLLNRLLRPADAIKMAERAVDLDPHNADAFLTLGLCWYRLGELSKGDKEIIAAGRKGKTQTQCTLQMGIARYHLIKDNPEAKEAPAMLEQAIAYIEQTIKSIDPSDAFSSKNMREARKYEELLQRVQYTIRSRGVKPFEASAQRPS